MILRVNRFPNQSLLAGGDSSSTLKLDEYELFRSNQAIKAEIEKKLLETDGGILLSIPGLGITTAAELTAEIGNLLSLHAQDN